jgi:hypothetical protein
VWNCAYGAIPQGWDEVLQDEGDLSLIKREWNKDAIGASGKLSWYSCRKCFRSCLHAKWLLAVATVGCHRQEAFCHEIFVTAVNIYPLVIDKRTTFLNDKSSFLFITLSLPTAKPHQQFVQKTLFIYRE